MGYLGEDFKKIVKDQGYPESGNYVALSIREDLEERYDIDSREENDQYWEDIAGAALIDEEVLDSVEDSSLEKLRWARNQRYSPRDRDIVTSVMGTGIGATALAKYGGVFLDGNLDAQTMGGVGVLASTLLLGYSTKQNIQAINEVVSKLPETKERYGSVAEEAIENIEHSGHSSIRPDRAMLTESKCADPELREEVDFAYKLLDSSEKSLNELVEEMDTVYYESRD